MEKDTKENKPLNPNNIKTSEAAKALIDNASKGIANGAKATGKGFCWVGRWSKKVGKAIASNPDK